MSAGKRKPGGEPSVEPLDLSQCRAHLRVLHSHEDELIGQYREAARIALEEDTSRALITQTWLRYLDRFPTSSIVLPRAPLQSVTHVKYFDEAGVLQTLAASQYVVDTESEPGRVVREATVAWPATQVRPNAVEIEFVVGYGDDPSDVPQPLRTAILLRLHDLYRNRGTRSSAKMSDDMRVARSLEGPYELEYELEG